MTIFIYAIKLQVKNIFIYANWPIHKSFLEVIRNSSCKFYFNEVVCALVKPEIFHSLVIIFPYSQTDKASSMSLSDSRRSSVSDEERYFEDIDGSFKVLNGKVIQK